MNIADRVRRILSRNDNSTVRKAFVIDESTRTFIEVYKIGLEQQVIKQLYGLSTTYDNNFGTEKVDMLGIVLSGEREEYRKSISNIVTKYAIATELAKEYDKIHRKDEHSNSNIIGCVVISNHLIAEMHPRYRSMGGKLNRNKFYDLIDKVHDELS